MLVAISGPSGSGKTTFITNLIQRLTNEFTVLVIKDTHRQQVDVMGKDTHCYRQAGATASALIAAEDTALFFAGRRGVDDLTALVNVDVILLEGFKLSHYPKIWLGGGSGTNEVLHNPPVTTAERYVREQVMADRLAGLDCGDCGYSSCIDLAKAIVQGTASSEACALPSERFVKVELDKQVIHLKPFVQKCIAHTIRGMLSALHGVNGDAASHISIEIAPGAPDSS